VYSKPYAGIIDLLTFLNDKGCKIAVLTNKLTQFAKQITDQVFPTIKFEYVLGPSAEYPKKPDIKGLMMMLKTLNVKEDECLYFGDTNTDMITANNAHVISVGVTWGFRSKDELINNKAQFIIDHPDEAIKLYNKFTNNN
jgi:phosphoglycolate phosphatase